MTAQQVRWAAQHDWFINATGEAHTGFTVHVLDDYTDANGHEHREALSFTSFEALRAFAGY